MELHEDFRINPPPPHRPCSELEPLRARAAGRSTPLPVHVLIETHGALSQGIVPAHNVCLNLKDAEVIAADATRVRREFGFQRMWSIHPAQIAPIVAAMRPALAEVDDACAIIQAAQEVDWGPIQYKGELHAERLTGTSGIWSNGRVRRGCCCRRRWGRGFLLRCDFRVASDR